MFPFRLSASAWARRVASTFAKLFALAALATVSLVVVGTLALTHDASGRNVLKQQVAARLTAMAGTGRRVEIGAIDVRFGGDALASVRLSDVEVHRRGRRTVPIRRVDVGLALLPLLKRQIQVTHLRLAGATFDVADSNLETEPSHWQLIRDFKSVPHLKRLHSALNHIEHELRERGVESIAISDVTVSGLDSYGLRVPRAHVATARIERDDRYIEGLTFEAGVSLAGEAAHLMGTWQAPDGNGDARTLRVRLSNIAASALPRVLTKGTTPVEIDAPIDVAARIPFAATGEPRPAFAWLRADPGRIWFGDVAPTAFDSFAVDLRLTPERDSLALLPSRFSTRAAKGIFEGGVARRADGTYEFEFATRRLESRAGGQAEFHPGGLSIAGRLLPLEKRLDLETVKFTGLGGAFAARGTLDLRGWPAGITMNATAPRLRIDTLKAFWPPFVAPKVRRWLVAGAVSGGSLTEARFDAAIPPGLLGELRDGGTLGPAELSMKLPIENATIRTVGDLPPIVGARGTVHVAGVSVSALLDGGGATLENGGLVNLIGSRVTVPDFLEKGLPAGLHIEAAGRARDIVRLAATKPLRIAQEVGISPGAVTGTVEVAADLKTQLLRKGTRPRDWTARIEVNDGALERPFKGHRVGDADVTIEAKPGLVKIDGTATVDGSRTRLAMVEPFGVSAGASAAKRLLAVRLDAAGRQRLGLDLGRYLTGPVDVRLRSVAGGWQVADVDLTDAALNLDFAAWRKGRGVPGRARFRFRTRDGVTRIEDLKVDGRGFGAMGSAAVDRRGVREARLREVRLGSDDSATLRVIRKGRRHVVKINAAEFDARALVSKLFAPSGSGGASKAANATSGRIELDGHFARVRGHGGVVARDVTLRLATRGSTVARLDLAAAIGKRLTSVSLTETSKGAELEAKAGNAGSSLRFAGLYSKMRGGRLDVRMSRDRKAAYRGSVSATDFALVGEPKLEALIASGRRDRRRLGRFKIAEARANVLKTADRLVVGNGRLRGGDMAATFEGDIYDAKGRMKLKGTFLPAYGLNRMVSAIPFVGAAAGSGKESGLLGVTFRLDGPWRSPALNVNPLSLFAPGVFRKIFE